ncbi:MAG: hypothetical protein U1E91_01975 [Moraxella sp.]
MGGAIGAVAGGAAGHEVAVKQLTQLKQVNNVKKLTLSPVVQVWQLVLRQAQRLVR